MKKERNNMGADMKKILIIDDDSRNIFALNAVLKSKGFICITAYSAEEGLTILIKRIRLESF